MKNNCKECKFCIFKDTEFTVGLSYAIANYKCNNPLSENHLTVMNVIQGPKHLNDSRKNNTCDKFENKHQNNFIGI